MQASHLDDPAGAVWSDLRMDGGGLQTTIHCEKHKEVAAGCDHHFSLVRHTVSKGLMPHRLEPDRRTLVLSRTGPGLDSLSANSHRVVLDIIRRQPPTRASLAHRSSRWQKRRTSRSPPCTKH